MTTITINRATVEQALEALKKNAKHLPVDFDYHFEALAALRAALAQQADTTDPGHDVDVLREHVRHLERRVRELHAQQAEPVEPVAKVIATAPKRIWLDLGFDPADEDITFDQLFEATWSQDNATGWGIEYVRADLVAPPQRKPLTDEEIEDIYLAWDVTPGRRIVGLVRAIERAHGIGEEK